MYTTKDKEGHMNITMTLTFKVSSQGEVNYSGDFVIPVTLRKLESISRLSLYHVYNQLEKVIRKSA